MTAVVHIAGIPLMVGPWQRQRCGWCGAVLLDNDVRGVCTCDDGAVALPPTWEPGALVAVDGAASYVVAHVDGEDLPAGACGALDPSVTT
jgi:hypothetical protein